MPNSYKFTDLPVELLHMIFVYLWGQDIFYTFFGVSRRLESVIKSYHRFHLNLKSIRKSQFDLICRHIRPEQIVTLILSNASDTPYQSNLFLSVFDIEHDFLHLRSLMLVESDSRPTRISGENFGKLFHHPSFKCYYTAPRERYTNHGSTYISCPFRVPSRIDYESYENDPSSSNRRYLKIFIHHYPFVQIKKIFQLCTRLTHLDVRWSSMFGGNLITFEHKHPCLTRFALRRYHGFSVIPRVQIEELLASVPHLQHLELEMSIGIDLIDGDQWEMLLTRHLPNLVRFDFKFGLEQTNYNSISQNTFRSAFWLSEKRWIVVFDPIDFGFNTVPRFARKSIGFPNNHDRSTDDQSLPFDHYVTCLHLSSMTDKQSFEKYHYMHVREIILNLLINDDWIERLGSIVVFDQVEELNIGRNQLLQVLMQIKPVMSRLQRLLVSSRSLTTLGKHNTKGLIFEHIRSLQFYDTECPVDKGESLCCLFPNLEHLKIYLKNRFNILPYLEQLKHLCVVACELKRASSDQHQRKRPTAKITHEWLVKNVPRWRVSNNFACEITKVHIYLWIENEHLAAL